MNEDQKLERVSKVLLGVILVLCAIISLTVFLGVQMS